MENVLKVLIVDDDDVDRMAIRRHLTKTEFTVDVVEASNASIACTHLYKDTFNFIFLDYFLPDTDGISLIKRIRTEGFSCPIVALTGQGDEQIAVDLMKAGASDYLTKSRLSPDNLARSIRNTLKVYQVEQHIQTAQQQLRQTNTLLKQQNRQLELQRHQIEQQNLQLLEANRLKSEFLATVTHELRTPLNAIMGFSQILKSQSKGTLNDYQVEMVNRIFTNGENLLALVNDILDMSTIEANRLELEPSYFDLHQLMRSTIAELQPLAESKRLDIRTLIALEEPNVYNDNRRLKQVLINLISNAIKFTDAGHVQVAIATLAPNSIEIIVEDTGIGIAPEQLEYIFQPFRQADQTIKRHYPGTGLGLAITHSLVSMMEGLITVQSEVGRGTSFRIQIPRLIFDPTVHDQAC